jgi:hypothetical protein
MAVGLGARMSNAGTKYFVDAQQNDYVSSGVAAGPVAVPFPGAPGAGGGGGMGLDSTSLLVWVITGVAIAVVVGAHVSFGGHRLF